MSSALIKNLPISFDIAIKLLEVNHSEREMYKQFVEQSQTENKE